jgi:hypothetical protein
MRKAMEFDTEVKLKIYEMTARNASIPNAAEVAYELGVPHKFIFICHTPLSS